MLAPRNASRCLKRRFFGLTQHEFSDQVKRNPSNAGTWSEIRKGPSSMALARWRLVCFCYRALLVQAPWFLAFPASPSMQRDCNGVADPLKRQVALAVVRFCSPRSLSYASFADLSAHCFRMCALSVMPLSASWECLMIGASVVLYACGEPCLLLLRSIESGDPAAFLSLDRWCVCVCMCVCVWLCRGRTYAC